MPLSPAEISQLLQGESVVEKRRRFYDRFDQAATFLLDLRWENLFEPFGRDGSKFRCKGCQNIVLRTDRPFHFDKHKRDYLATNPG